MGDSLGGSDTTATYNPALTRSPLMPEPLDHRLRDDTVLDEIELTSRLMIAATELGRPLSQHEVDEILGVVAS
ncbi:MAG TPA: hypothetical protein VNT92_08205 [Acidimicrobiia bacterium]|nr:hypothetical protein [Acidimicrobiia bacterium]